MIDPVYIYATYGPGMGFELALGNDGDFAFTLAGNMGPLFPLHQLGFWQGHDPQRVANLCQQSLRQVRATPSNAPPMPDSAFIAIRYESQGGVVAGEYALYEPPPAIAPVIQEAINLVHGDWLKAALATLSADYQLVAGESRLTIEITLHAFGNLPVQLANPLATNVFAIVLIDSTGESTLEVESHDLLVSANRDIRPELPFIELMPGEALTLTVTILTDIPAGDWKLITTMELGSVPDAAGKLAAGVLTWGPAAVVVPIP